jgi:hypothetical protein
MWLWYLVGFVYLLLAIVEWRFATKIEKVNVPDLPPLKLYPLGNHSEEDLEEQYKNATDSAVGEYNKGLVGLEPHMEYLKRLSDNRLVEMQRLNFNNAVNRIESVAHKFDRAVDANRKTLKLAAISFVGAAVISFVQGLGWI